MGALASLPPSLRSNPKAQALARSNDAKTTALTNLRGKLNDPTERLKGGITTLGAAFGAGVIDSMGWTVPIGGGKVKPSTVAGLVAAGGALFTGSTMLADVAIGALTPTAYDLGMQAAAKMNKTDGA